jgi:hypothetical protein
MIRKPAVAGEFYPALPKQLEREISRLISVTSKKRSVLGILSPHAGYAYSGSVAGLVFSKIELPKTIIIIGPNHTGAGGMASISSKDEWEMPGGIVKMNRELAEIIMSKTGLINEDRTSHQFEHSLEVQIPFIQYFLDAFDIVPICMRRIEFSKCGDIGIAIATSIKEYGKPVLIISSSDMTHYESKENANRKDKMALDKIMELDPEGLYETVQVHSISMCGFIPVAIMLVACKEMGAYGVEIVKRMTSGDITGDNTRVVGYAGAIVY